MVRRIVLWRHGRTEWNATGRFQGHSDIELDSLGHQQAKAAAAVLHQFEPGAIVSSDLRRAVQTAEPLSALTGLTVVKDMRLRETGFGPWEGKTVAELQTMFPAEYRAWRQGIHPTTDGIEQPADVTARLKAALADIASLEVDTAVVVAHGGCVRRAISTMLGWSDEQARSLGVLGNCCWAEVRADTHGWRLASYNVAVQPVIT